VGFHSWSRLHDSPSRTQGLLYCDFFLAHICQRHCQSLIFNAAKIARTIRLQSPRKRSRVTVLYREMTDEKEIC